MVLYTGRTMSIYTDYDTYVYDSIVTIRLADIIATGQRKSPRAGLRLTNPLATKTIKNNNTKTVYTIETFYKNFQKSERFPETNWKISRETKDIAGFRSQKAYAWVLGRYYETWFCTDFKFSNGPWKLGGLPGLILEAHDQKGEVFFTCTGFSLPSPGTPVVKLPLPTISASPEEYAKLKRAFLEDPVSFFENTPGLVSGTMSGGIRQTNSGNIVRPKNKLSNNTLELPAADAKSVQ
jgi:GLPGLI family protein